MRSYIFLDYEVFEPKEPDPDGFILYEYELAEVLWHEIMHAKFHYERIECIHRHNTTEGCTKLEFDHERMHAAEDRLERALY